MSKYKKTRNQKIISDLRRKLQAINSPVISTITISEKPTQEKQVSLNTTRTAQLGNTSYKSAGTYVDVFPYLYHDLIKTALLTSSIIATQLILFFLFKNHVIALPIAGF